MALAGRRMVARTLPVVLANQTHRLALQQSLERKLVFPCPNKLPHPSDVAPSSGMILMHFRHIMRGTSHNPEEKGLQYHDVRVGEGDEAKKTDKVEFKYWHLDQKGNESKEFEGKMTLGGKHDYGDGFDEGICGMKCKGERILMIPHKGKMLPKHHEGIIQKVIHTITELGHDKPEHETYKVLLSRVSSYPDK